MKKIQIYDTTLRDGSQGEDISFSLEDKLHILKKLDELGLDYVEGGWPGSNSKDIEFFRRAQELKLKHAKLTAFGSTRHPRHAVAHDPNLAALIEANTPVVTVFGKSWDLHVRVALGVSLKENLELIRESVAFLKSKGKEVIYDAEHFFDGFKADSAYALATLQAAEEAGADTLVLCDTNGGTMTADIRERFQAAASHVNKPLGIHTHNDCEMAVANSIAAVQQGAVQVQGTINGYGERCGNANLCSVIPNIELKLGLRCIGRENLKRLTELEEMWLPAGDSSAKVDIRSYMRSMLNEAGKLEFNKSKTVKADRQVPAEQPYTQPYWLVKPPNGDVYTVDDQALIGLADTPSVLTVRFRLSIDGAPFELERPVAYRYADRAEGERVRPLVVIPPVAVDLPESVAIFPKPEARKVAVSVKANTAKAGGDLRIEVPAGWKVDPKTRSFQIATAGEQEELSFVVTPPQADSTATLRAVATVGGREIAAGVQVISYPHIPDQTLLLPANVKLVRSDIRVTARRIGYIMGAGDEMPDALRQLGLEVTLLRPPDLEEGDLSRFDAIVAGVRAYNVRADVRSNQPRLLDYVKNGGTYVVQYNTGDNSLNMGPYPFTVPPGTRYRITYEDSPMTLPHVDSRLLQAPNHIASKDFDGWVQERGLYFSTKWDSHYETVLSSKDPGEAELPGGELWTRYGKGVYIFTAYSWFRQLPAGVPGAYRLFANLLSAK
jgi:hypothetical protein